MTNANSGFTITIMLCVAISSGNASSPDLLISQLKHSDEGKWQCEASNSIGTAQSPIMSIDVKRKHLCYGSFLFMPLHNYNFSQNIANYYLQ